MRNGTFYLNNSGSRWINLTNGQKDKLTFVTESGKTVVRTAIFYESFGFVQVSEPYDEDGIIHIDMIKEN